MSHSNSSSDGRAKSPSHQAFDSGKPLPVSARVIAPGHTEQTGGPQTASSNSGEGDSLGVMGRSKLAILLIVFLAAGITGLPLIILSQRFSKGEKVFWTIATLAYTVLVFYLFYLAILWIGEQLQSI